MNLIKKSTAKTEMLIGDQEIRGGIHYRPFLYTTVTEVDGEFVACNRLTRTLAIVSEEEKKILTYGTDTTEGAEELIKKWFLVPDEHDDYQFCNDTRQLFKVFAATAKNKVYTIMTTTDCNARCFYCYQMGRNKARVPMSEDTAKAVAEYIIKTAGEASVNIQWYGGEPLYNPSVIDIVCTALAKAGVNFHSTMISNGYLFSGELLEKATSLWKLKKVQVPIDGTESVYNRVKAYIHRDVENHYAIVMDNIKNALDNGIKILARINMDKHNREDIYALADELASRFGEYKNFAVYCDVLYENAGTKKPQREAEERLELVNNLIEFENYCKEKGIIIPRKYAHEMTVSRCMADSGNAVVISPLGELGPCDHAMESQVYGTVFSAERDMEMINAWKEPFNCREVCKNCSNFPECQRLKKCPDDGPMLCDAAYKKKMFHRHVQTVKNEYRHIAEENAKKDK